MKVQTQVLWDYRMDPPPFSFVTGSCAYINEAQYDRPGGLTEVGMRSLKAWLRMPQT